MNREELAAERELLSPPGDSIAETIEHMEITRSRFAELIGMKGQDAKRLIQGKMILTAEIALKLEEVLKIDASFWVNRERSYREKLAEIEEAEAEMKTLITASDKAAFEKIRKLITQADKTEAGGLDYESHELYVVLDRAIFNLENGLNYFKKLPESETHWFDAECGACGWFGSSQYLQGGSQIADTGDYGDCYCPVCGDIYKD